MAEEQPIPPDPIRTQSLSMPIAVSTFLLIVTTGWAIWDEAVHKRPYIEYQQRWVGSFGDYLTSIEGDVRDRESRIIASAEYKTLSANVQAAKKASEAGLREVIAKLNAIDPELKALDYTFRDSKGRMDEYTNRIENAEGSSKDSLRAELESFKQKEFSVEVPDPKDPTKTIQAKYTPVSLVKRFQYLKAEQGRLQGERGILAGPEQEAAKALDAFKAKQLRGVSSGAIASMKGELETFKYEIKQIHVADMGELVDRCESCHLGARSPIPIKAEDVGGERTFVSHPNGELLAIHDPDRFGCSPCHGGNGVGVINVETAHGKFKHWLWPMWEKENREAGCNQCHGKDLVLGHAATLNQGKELFRKRGCWGCHRYEGYDTENEELTIVRKDIQALDLAEDAVKTKIADVNKAIARVGAHEGSDILDSATRALCAEVAMTSPVVPAAKHAGLSAALSMGRLDDELKSTVIEALQDRIPALTQQVSQAQTNRGTKSAREHELILEMKKVGPSLKEVRMKINPAWLPGWIKDPSVFRPDTKMPTYARIDEGQAQAIAAFIWSRGVVGPLEKKQPGDAARGEVLVRDRGCVACHSAKIGGEIVGNDFAANLSRVGEKDNFDYLVRWVSNPKQKTLPFSFGLKRDLTPEDFQKAGFPFEFDHQNPSWPKEWGTLLTHQMTVMPNLRLSDEDARDIASYLMTQKQDGASYPDAAGITGASKELIDRGERLVKNYGCAGCHEIAGMEDAQRIGTELTKEGSKPIERLDFGQLTHVAEHDGYYNVKGFVDRKLKDPQIWDQGKEPAEELGGLKMPNFRLSDGDITAVSTFIQGSLETNIPPKYQYLPADQRQAVQDGWWVVKKYNCVGCHAFEAGALPALWTTPWFSKAGEDMPEVLGQNGESHRGGPGRRPPTLVGEGARVDPQWLAEFLRNPALSRTNVHRNGVRPYLNVRMPTYDMSDGEISKIVRFFGALANQTTPYVRPEQVPLTDAEAAAGRAIFNEVNGCAKCHATGEQTTFTKDINAPGFHLAAARLRPQWIQRWILDPAQLIPGSNMPTGLFKRDGRRWVVNKNDVPEALKSYTGDHADLMARFLAQFNSPGVFKPK